MFEPGKNTGAQPGTWILIIGTRILAKASSASSSSKCLSSIATIRGIREVLGVDRRTMERWRQWWLDAFVRGSFWRVERARFVPVVEETTLPWSLCGRFATLVEVLRFLAPLSRPPVWAEHVM